MGVLPSEWVAAGLILAALLLVAVDLHLVGQGFLAAGAVALLVLAGLLLAVPGGAAALQVRPELLVVLVLLCLAFVAVAVRGALTVRRLGSAGLLPPAAGRPAVALTDLAPRGIVRLDREEWSASADPGLPPVGSAGSGQAGGLGGGQATTNRLQAGGALAADVVIRAGEPVEVVAQDGLYLRVRRASSSASFGKEA